MDVFVKRVKEAVLGTSDSGVPAVDEVLTSDLFHVSQTVRHGFVFQASALAVDPVQRLVAIGNRSGGLVILGNEAVQTSVRHAKQFGVVKLAFLVNEGALLSITEDNCLHLWTLRQKIPTIVQTLQFSQTASNSGRLTCCCTPLNSDWVYVGTDIGNVFSVKVESFQVSGYAVYWNHIVGVSAKDRPGPVHAMGELPSDPTKLLLAFDYLVALWDWKSKSVVFRCHSKQVVCCLSWLSDGRQFMTGHQRGAISIWNGKDGTLLRTVSPHARQTDEVGCSDIKHLEWLSTKEDPTIIFSGGHPEDAAEDAKSVTILSGRGLRKIPFRSRVVSFVSLRRATFPDEIQDPHSLVVLLEDSVEVVDLLTAGFPRIPSPYGFALHASPVTCLTYEADIPPFIFEKLATVGRSQVSGDGSQRRSSRHWPLMGGIPSTITTDFSDLLITGHADGTVRFWDISQVTMPLLYTLHVSKWLEQKDAMPVPTLADESAAGASSHANKHDSPVELTRAASSPVMGIIQSQNQLSSEESYPFAIQQIFFCGESNTLLVSLHLGCTLICNFSSEEKSLAIAELHASIAASEPGLQRSMSSPSTSHRWQTTASRVKELSGSEKSLVSLDKLACRRGSLKQAPGYHASFGIHLRAGITETVPITCFHYNASFGLLALGCSHGLCIFDVVQHKVLLSCPVSNVATMVEQAISHRQRTNTSIDGGEKAGHVRLPGRRSSREHIGVTTPTGEGFGLGARLASHGKKARSVFGKRKTEGSEYNGSVSMDQDASSRRIHLSGDEEEDEFEGSVDSPFEAPESVNCLHFALTYSSKGENEIYPSLWIGTSYGHVIGLTISMPPTVESRALQEVSWDAPSCLLRVSKHQINDLAVLGSDGEIMVPSAEAYSDPRSRHRSRDRQRLQSEEILPGSVGQAASQQAKGHYLVVVSDHSAWTYSLPSHAHCKSKLREGTVVLRSKFVSIEGGSCLVCLTLDGHLLAYSLPSLNPLMDFDYVAPQDLDIRMARSFCWAHGGQALYMSSPFEIQRLSLLRNNLLDLPDSLPDLHIVLPFPERVPKGFFARMLGPSCDFDRQQLFGDSDASQSVATRVSGSGGMEGALLKTGTTLDALLQARRALDERVDRLNQLDQKTAQMSANASMFAQNMRALSQKYQNRSWWQF